MKISDKTTDWENGCVNKLSAIIKNYEKKILQRVHLKRSGSTSLENASASTGESKLFKFNHQKIFLQ